MFVTRMTRRACLFSIAGAAGLAAVKKGEKGFVSMFDGKTLKGWKGDPRLWKVEQRAIAGCTDGIELTANSFLTYVTREFSDFTFRCSVKLRNHNSGVQYRSVQLPDYVVKGYQADMAEDNWWGGIYEEKGTRGVMVNGWTGKAEKVVKRDDWNDLEIHCNGPYHRITLNGMVTAELEDTSRMKGIIALQLHRGPGMRVDFRELRIQPLA